MKGTEYMKMSKGMKKQANAKAIPKAEKKRRAEQSKRDKAMAQQRAMTSAANKGHVDPTKRSIVKAKKNMPVANSLNALASAMSVPALSPPQRVPTIPRVRTDVKHFYDKNQLNYSAVPPARTYFSLGSMASSAPLPHGTFMTVVTRDPVTPGFVSKPFKSKGTGFTLSEWRWLPYWKDRDSVLGMSPTISGFNNFCRPIVVEYPDQIQPVLMAGTSLEVVPQSSELDFVMTRCVSTGGDYTTEDAPAGMYGGRYYAWHYGGKISIFSQAINYQGTPMLMSDYQIRIIVKMNLKRWRGVATDPETKELTLVITGMNGEVSTPVVPCGYYVMDVTSVQLNNYSAQDIDLGVISNTFGVVVAVSSLMEYTSSTATEVCVMTPVVLPLYKTATYMLEKVRVTASAMLVSNVSQELAKAGEIYGIRCAGEQGFFTELNTDAVYAISGQISTSYSGLLAKGCYTFIEPDGEMMNFKDHAFEYLGVNIPFSRLERLEFANVVMATWPTDGSLASALSVVVRHDFHLEFVSNSQLANPNVTAALLAEYEAATVALSAGSFFYENPHHLGEIWNWIRKAGAIALGAGVSAAKRSLLEQGLALLAI